IGVPALHAFSFLDSRALPGFRSFHLARVDRPGAREVGGLVGFRRGVPGVRAGGMVFPPTRRGTAQQPATSRVACSLCKLDHLLSPVRTYSTRTGRATTTRRNEDGSFRRRLADTAGWTG